MTDTSPFAQLVQAYAATHYWVIAANAAHDVRVHRPVPPALEMLLPDAPWCIITAANPVSQRSSDHQNHLRNRQLAADIDRRGLVRWPTRARADDRQPSWPDEPGWLVGNVNRALIRHWCQTFDQLAVVHGHGNRPPCLLFITARARQRFNAVDIPSDTASPPWLTWLDE